MLDAALERVGSFESNHLLEELGAAALVCRHFEMWKQMAASRFGSEWHIDVSIAGEDNSSGLPAVMQWRILAPQTSTFEFRPAVYRFDNTDGVFRFYIRLLPLFKTYAFHHHAVLGSVAVSLWDAGIVPGISFCAARPDHFLVPDPHFISHYGYQAARMHFLQRADQWSDRYATALWRGSTTGQAPDGWPNLPRVKLCEIAHRQDDPSLIDAGFSHVTQLDAKVAAEIEAAGLIKGYIDWRRFDEYKYQIDIDGNTNSWPGLFLKLLAGSTVLKVESGGGFRQWYYNKLKPWENFVPVATDMSDLAEKILWLRCHDEHARAIGQAGRRLAMSLEFQGELQESCSTIAAALRYTKYESERLSRLKLRV